MNNIRTTDKQIKVSQDNFVYCKNGFPAYKVVYEPVKTKDEKGNISYGFISRKIRVN